jgi:hypothetical protein
VKRQKRQTSNKEDHGPISSGNLEKACVFVSHDLSLAELEVVLNKEKFSKELFQFTKDVHYHMKWLTADRRQKILTDQYLNLASFPGHDIDNDLFFSNEFWYEKDGIRAYFEKFNIKWSTEYVEVGLGRLFNTKPCFHLQMLDHYVMPPYGEFCKTWQAASKAWREDCSLDR